jgi:hypothetical protein
MLEWGVLGRGRGRTGKLRSMECECGEMSLYSAKCSSYNNPIGRGGLGG